VPSQAKHKQKKKLSLKRNTATALFVDGQALFSSVE